LPTLASAIRASNAVRQKSKLFAYNMCIIFNLQLQAPAGLRRQPREHGRAESHFRSLRGGMGGSARNAIFARAAVTL